MSRVRGDRSLCSLFNTSSTIPISKSSRFAYAAGVYRSKYYVRLHRTPLLQQTGQHNGPLLLVLISELLTVGLLLAPAPDIHVVRADGDENDEGGRTRDEDDADPRDDLEHVVGARHEAEAQPVGDLARRLAGLAQRREIPVDVGVAELAEDVQGQAEDVERRGEEVARVRGRGEGSVDLEGAQEPGEDPVEERVAHDEGGGHRVGAELVHEQNLELPLHEVRHDHEEGGLLHRGQRARRRGGRRRRHDVLDVRVHGRIQVVADAGEEGVEDERADVFAEVDESPRDLRACRSQGAISSGHHQVEEEARNRTKVFDYDLAVLHHGLLFPYHGIAVLEGLLGDRVEDADAVEVGCLGRPGDFLLGELDGRVVREREGGRETLQALPGPIGEFEGESHLLCIFYIFLLYFFRVNYPGEP